MHLEPRCSFIFCSSTVDPQEAQCSSRDPTTLHTTAPAGMGGALWLLPHAGQRPFCRSSSTAHVQHNRWLHGVITGLSTTFAHFLHCRSDSRTLWDGGTKRLRERGWPSPQEGFAEFCSDSMAVGGLPLATCSGRPPSLCL